MTGGMSTSHPGEGEGVQALARDRQMQSLARSLSPRTGVHWETVLDVLVVMDDLGLLGGLEPTGGTVGVEDGR